MGEYQTRPQNTHTTTGSLASVPQHTNDHKKQRQSHSIHAFPIHNILHFWALGKKTHFRIFAEVKSFVNGIPANSAGISKNDKQPSIADFCIAIKSAKQKKGAPPCGGTPVFSPTLCHLRVYHSDLLLFLPYRIVRPSPGFISRMEK